MADFQTQRFPARHPLCTCPDREEFPWGVDVNRDTCPYPSIAHPVVDAETLQQIVNRHG